MPLCTLGVSKPDGLTGIWFSRKFEGADTANQARREAMVRSVSHPSRLLACEMPAFTPAQSQVPRDKLSSEGILKTLAVWRATRRPRGQGCHATISWRLREQSSVLSSLESTRSRAVQRVGHVDDFSFQLAIHLKVSIQSTGTSEYLVDATGIVQVAGLPECTISLSLAEF